MNIARDCVWRLRAMLTQGKTKATPQRKTAEGGLMTKNGGYSSGESAGEAENWEGMLFFP